MRSVYVQGTIVLIVVVLLISGGALRLNYSRERARRRDCELNLRLMGIATHLHNDALQTLPHAGAAPGIPPIYRSGIPQVKEQQLASWAFQLLPYMEQNSVHEGGRRPGDSDSMLASRAMFAVMPVYYCPARRTPNPVSGNADITPILKRAYPDAEQIYMRVGVMDYAAGNASDPYRGAFTKLDLANKPSDDPLVVNNSLHGLEGLTDGTPNVILIAEKRLDPENLGLIMPDDGAGYCTGWSEETVRAFGDAFKPGTGISPAKDKWGSKTGENKYGSAHSGGLNVVAGDASVKFVSYNINPEVWARLGTRNDGQSVEE